MELKYLKKIHPYFYVFFLGLLSLIIIIAVFYQQKTYSFNQKIRAADNDKINLNHIISSISSELKYLKNQDQYLINEKLEEEIKNIENTYNKTVTVYEDLLKLKEISKNTSKFDESFTDIINLLSERNFSSAEAKLNLLTKTIKDEQSKIEASFNIPANIPTNNAPPGSGYSRQVVKTDIGEFMIDIVTADLNSTKVMVDTASDSDCRNDCPVLSLGDYVSRNGAFAGINGSYFCPASYPSCSDKKNSFDTLLMNKNKKYFNSDNNVYSTVPAVIFSGNSVRFVRQSLEWGRDTGVDSMIANQPLLIYDGQLLFTGDDEIKRSGQGARSFIGAKDNLIYIGVVYNINVAQAAKVLHTLGMKYALNLDSGGSTALWSGGYKVGPGRNIPNAILFIRR